MVSFALAAGGILATLLILEHGVQLRFFPLFGGTQIWGFQVKCSLASLSIFYRPCCCRCSSAVRPFPLPRLPRKSRCKNCCVSCRGCKRPDYVVCSPCRADTSLFPRSRVDVVAVVAAATAVGDGAGRTLFYLQYQQTHVLVFLFT